MYLERWHYILFLHRDRSISKISWL